MKNNANVFGNFQMICYAVLCDSEVMVSSNRVSESVKKEYLLYKKNCG